MVHTRGTKSNFVSSDQLRRKKICNFTENTQVRKIQHSPVKYRAEKGYYFPRRLSKISLYSNLGQTLLFLVRHGSANKNGSCWRITLLQGRSPGRIRGRANTPLSGGKNGWLSSNSLAQADEEGEEWGRWKGGVRVNMI